MFFLSGAAALVYQVVWVRSLILVFGGSHLAVTSVLTIFMAGLALGGYAMGRYVDRVSRPLRLYGILEIGIAVAALAFMALMRAYPSIYTALAGGREASVLYVSALRVLFAAGALIVPTALMGGTLPVLSRLVSRGPDSLQGHLSFLYGVNTLGAVLGAVAAAFFLLPGYSVTASLYAAILTNAVIGIASLVLQDRIALGGPRADEVTPQTREPEPAADVFLFKAVLWGIGLSGFCALGYEVLWTRILTIAIGASVYSFTVMLIAFLTGIGLGSAAYGVLWRLIPERFKGTRPPFASFGVVQIVIGATALLVTIYMRDLPANAIRLQDYVAAFGFGSFGMRTWSGFALAFLYMVVPAFFMGVAFPLAGALRGRYTRTVGRAVGEVLAYNTLGALAGAAVSGFVLIYAFGIERSLQMLAVANIGLGLFVLASRGGRRRGTGVAAATVMALLVLALHPRVFRVWDTNYFAIFRSNQPEAFRSPEMIREAVENTDVLYYAEGVESIVSVIRVKGGEQAFITNGRVEASSHLQAQQVQLTLGHLPMLLHQNPRNVLVVGLGSGMTLGATSVHPTVERLTLLELEPKVLGVARTFAAYNHNVLDNPKLRTVFNDGRNFLLTTPEKFDVITADPIHPWFRGAGYLYTTEYFKLAAQHLRAGGVICQWLPIYELTPRDLQSIVRSFRAHFTHTLMWLTHYDAHLVGSNSPLLIDEAELEKRIVAPAVASDLRKVRMGSATDFLSYFVMGAEGMERFGRGGILNTDDNLHLEFSAPFSIATPSVMEANVTALAAHRESILPYLVPASGLKDSQEQRRRWTLHLEAASLADPLLARFLGGASRDIAFKQGLDTLTQAYPGYAPGQFLRQEYDSALAMEPRLIQQSAFTLAAGDGRPTSVEISAVLVPVSAARASIMFVDNRARVVYGQRYLNDYRAGKASMLATDVMAAVGAVYQREAEAAARRGRRLPPADETLQKFKEVIGSRVSGN
jgi:spermidine synthase